MFYYKSEDDYIKGVFHLIFGHQDQLLQIRQFFLQVCHVKKGLPADFEGFNVCVETKNREQSYVHSLPNTPAFLLSFFFDNIFIAYKLSSSLLCASLTMP